MIKNVNCSPETNYSVICKNSWASPLKRLLITFLLIFLIGCASTQSTKKDDSFFKNLKANSLYERAKSELKKREIVPAIRDIVHAELLTADEELKIKISNLKEDIFNHIQVQTALEEKAILKYTLLYNEDDIFYPVENMQVTFNFLEGEGTVTKSAHTNSLGTAQGKIEKIARPRKSSIIEAFPVVALEKETIPINELKRVFIVPGKSPVDQLEIERLKKIIVDSVNISIDFVDRILEEMFPHHMW